MAVLEQDTLKDGLVFDLGSTQKLDSVLIWNYNKPAYTEAGAAKANVSIWTEAGGWKTVLKEAVILEAEGSQDYDEPTVLTFEPIDAQKVRIDNLVCIAADSKQVGLSKVRFYSPLGPAACNPIPADKAAVSLAAAMPMRWSAGKNALVHAVYLGEKPDNLSLRGKLTGAGRVDVEGLKPETTYYWSVEETQQDGTVTKGPVWSFVTQKTFAAHWPLDENADDTSGAFKGSIHGTAQWVEGHSGKAMQFDGKTSVEIAPLNLESNAATICGWLRVEKPVDAHSGIFFCRSDEEAAGLSFRTTRSLGYSWTAKNTHSFNARLQIPLNQWVFAAVAVEPEKATLYLWDGKELRSAVNCVPHTKQTFASPILMGRDPINDRRFFAGCLDDVRVFSYALNAEQVDSLCSGKEIAFADEIRLVNGSFVSDEQSLEEIAKKGAEQQAAPGRNRKANLIAVAVIAAAVLGFVFVTNVKKKR